MTDDDWLRSLLVRQVALAPEPPSVAEILSRCDALTHRHAPRRRRLGGGVQLAAAAVGVTVLVGGLVAIGTRGNVPGSQQPAPPVPTAPTVTTAPTGTTEPTVTSAPPVTSRPTVTTAPTVATVAPAPGAIGQRVGAYYLPTGLPDGYRMLSIDEHAVFPGRIDHARAVYQTAAGGLIELEPGDAVVDAPPWTDSESLGDGATGRWTFQDVGPLGPYAAFEVEFADGVRVSGSVRAVDRSSLPQLLADVRPGADGQPPSLDGDGHTLLGATPRAEYGATVEWTAVFGTPGGYYGFEAVVVTVRRFDHALDPAVIHGVWNETIDVDGRLIHRGVLNAVPVWYPEPDLEVSIEAFGGLDAAELLAGLHPVDDVAFDQTVAEIESASGQIPLLEVVEFTDGTLELLGSFDSPRGVCLTVAGTRRCDLAVMASAGYTDADTIVFFDTDLLVGGRWFTLGLRVMGGDDGMPPVPENAETIVIDNRSYFLVERPADADHVTEPDGDTATRPAR
jgi:hypothetical protein